MINSRRRWYGLLFLLLSAGMLIWGQTWLEPYLRRGWFVGYWTACLGWTLLALLTALWDLRVTRRQARAEQVEMLRRAFGGEGADGGARPSRDLKSGGGDPMDSKSDSGSQ